MGPEKDEKVGLDLIFLFFNWAQLWYNDYNRIKIKEGHMVKNKVTVTIAGQEFNLVATEDAAYMERVAACVDQKITEMQEAGARPFSNEPTILAAVNLADELFKEQDAAEKLRGQLKQYLEEISALKLELSEAKREIFKLENQGKK